MKLSTKIYMIIGGFVALFIGVVLYFVMTGVNKDVDFANHELEGNAYLRPLIALQNHAGRHQLLVLREIAGDTSAKSEREALYPLVDEEFKKLTEADLKYSASLLTTREALKGKDRAGAHVEALKQEWIGIKNSPVLGESAVARGKHEAFMKNIGDGITNAGDRSELILDPDLDTYYVMSYTLLDIPDFQMRMTKAATLAFELAQSKGLGGSRDLDVSAAILKEKELARVLNDSQQAIQYNKENQKEYGVSPTLENKLGGATKSFADSTERFVSALGAIADGRRTDADLKQLYSAESSLRDELVKTWSTAVEEMDDMLKKRVSALRAEELKGLLIAAAAIIAAVLLSFIILRTTTRAIEAVSSELSDLAAGEANLSRRLRVRSSDEVGVLSGSFNKVMDKMLGLVRQVQQSGAQVTSSSTQIAASTKELQAAVSEQAASTNEIVATTKEISVTSQNLVKTMSDISKMALDTAELAGAGRTNLEGMEATIRGLADATSSISFKLSVISEKASNINKIVSTISKVADQTNLLSLNASIEAEKAGEHGLGFAVVAREIRRLADQTAVSTLDIERMVTEMRSAVTTGVMEMDKFTKDVSSGVDEVNKIGGQLTRIMERVQALAPRFETVTDGMQAQSQGAQQINEAMMHLSDAAKQTMDALRQTNGAIAELNEAARGLHHEVSRFRTVSGESTVEHVGLHGSHAA